MQIAPYGSWSSPITPETVTAVSIRYADSVELDGDAAYWSESRPQEGGRSVIVRCDADGCHHQPANAHHQAALDRFAHDILGRGDAKPGPLPEPEQEHPGRTQLARCLTVHDVRFFRIVQRDVGDVPALFIFDWHRSLSICQ